VDVTARPTGPSERGAAEQVSLADESRPNEDSFDALICAAALDLDLPLITRDGLIQDWGSVRTVW
jgi:hypothetical protein